MKMGGSQIILAQTHIVWASLLDAEVLKASIPGCQEVVGSVEDGFEAIVVQKVGPVKATFKGNVVFEQMHPPETLVLRGEGKGGVAGFAKGSANVKLTPDADGTLLEYEVEAQIGGKLAQLGSRIIDGFAKKMADQFFVRFKSIVESETTGEQILAHRGRE